jgi:DNA-binding transcriptional LysR family regulator
MLGTRAVSGNYNVQNITVEKDYMSAITLHELQCFDAVVREAGFKAAAEKVHRSHPAVFAAVAKLERQLGLVLLDRSGYRVVPTQDGKALHRRVESLLREAEGVQTYAQQLAMGVEAELRVVIGDICPRQPALALLSRFFRQHPGTRLHLSFESVGGPVERLLDGDADLVLHVVDKLDARLEWADLSKVAFVPVAAPAFFGATPPDLPSTSHLRDFTQCVLRDSARHSLAKESFIVQGAAQCSVPDQGMKKELILHGLAWGHLPRFLVEEELRDGRLDRVPGLPGSVEELVMARMRQRPHGPVAAQLWLFLGKHAADIRRVETLRRVGATSRKRKDLGSPQAARGPQRATLPASRKRS